MRVALHVGRCVGGIVGNKNPRYHLFGKAVDVVMKMEPCGTTAGVIMSTGLHDSKLRENAVVSTFGSNVEFDEGSVSCCFPAFASLLASGHLVPVSEGEKNRLELKSVDGTLKEWRMNGLNENWSRSLLRQMVIDFNVQDYSRGELSFVVDVFRT